MYQYILKRLLLLFPTLIGAAILVFFLMRLIPGDVCELRMARQRARTSTRTPTQDLPGRARSRPAADACSSGISSAALFTFDFGKSMWTGQPIVDEIGLRFQLSLQVAIMATIVGDRARHSARHDFRDQAEHLDRLRRARVLDRRHRHAVVLARHPDHSRLAHHDEVLVRHGLDAADPVQAALGRPGLQPVAC